MWTASWNNSEWKWGLGVDKIVDARPNHPLTHIIKHKNNAKLDPENKRLTKRTHKKSLNAPKLINVMVIIIKEIRINSS